MVFLVIFLLSLGIIFIPVAGFVYSRCDFTNGITISERRFYQHIIDTEEKYQNIIRCGSANTAIKNLKLSFQVLPSDELNNCESVLCPSDSEQFFGTIKCAKADTYDMNFRYYHEIIHYIDDVGIGNRVKKSYSKDHSGETRSHKEQIVNFKAAAVAIPKNQLIYEISQYSGDCMNPEFLSKMQLKFKQPEIMIRRRIKEVCQL